MSALRSPAGAGPAGMPSDRLATALRALPLLRLGFTHRLLEDAWLPVIKGDLWRSVLGMALHEVAPAAAAFLMADVRDESARPWALAGPELLDDWIPAGADLPGSILLAGGSCRNGPVSHADVVRALAAMAMRTTGAPERGLGSMQGRGRAQAVLTEVSVWEVDGGRRVLDPREALGDEPQAGSSRTGWTDAWAVWDAAHKTANDGPGADPAASGLRLSFATPLRLKQHGDLFRAPPPLTLLLQRLLGRLVLLLPSMPAGVFEPGEKDALLALASACPLVGHAIGGFGWNRYSARQGREMPFEGMLGNAEYAAPAGLLYPWFQLANWLQLGGKTTFGFGVVRARIITGRPGED